MISACKLTKFFGRTPALRAVDLRLETGQTLAVLGPNGAGKTTLLRLLATLDKPTSGTLELSGIDALRQPGRARGLLGVIGHQTLLHADLTVLENLRFYGRLYGVPDSRLETQLAGVGLYERRDLRASDLSRGQQQRLAIARALLHDPPILLMDEPDTGLDAEGRDILEGVIRDQRRTVVFSSHNQAWAAPLASEVLQLRGGRLTA